MTKFDVFLSHNSKDKPAVRELTRLLEARRIRVWLDEEQLVPGRPWQPLLEKGIEGSATGAVLVGKDGLGPWENEEMLALLSQAVSAGKPVIPVLLPDAPREPKLLLFLRNRTWVDLRPSFTDESIDKLIWGITGEKPDSLGEWDELDQQTATTPAQLWPDDSLAGGSGEATNCYARLHAICAGGEVPRPEERRTLWQAVKQERPSSFLAWQLAGIARWGAPEYLEVDEHFTPLQVQVRVRERDEGPAEKQQLACDTLAEAMSAVFEEQMAPASVIFAPPGGGKSTLLRHYQLQQARRLGEDERLVLYVQLRDYRPEKLPEEDRDTDLPALAWLESEWREETGQAPPLAAFLRQRSLTLLLDGLNEIPRRSDEEYRARVGEWRNLVETVDHNYPGVRLLFACRPLDYSQRLDEGCDTHLPEIEVQPMEPERIKAFIDKRFDPRRAAQVWTQLEDRPALALYSSPYALNLLLGQIDTKAREIEIPQDRAALFSGMVRARLRRECQKGNARFADPELLSDVDRTVLMGGRPGAHWLPEDTRLFEALAALAFHIQDAGGSNERWGSLRRRKARQAIAAALESEPETEPFLQAGYDLGLFEDESAQAGKIRFVHQQMQEYFAAWVLAEDWDADKLRVPWKSAALPESTEALLAGGGDDDLPELPSTGWEESALMAASLCERPEAFIRDLIPANLPLAGRCAAQPGPKISEELRGKLRKLLVARTQELQADLRARIAAGKVLGELGDPRLKEQSVAARVKPLLPVFAAIPGGKYRIGGDPKGFAAERPAREVTLPGFELAVHPVTNAEFARFLHSGGYREDAYWPGRALAWRKGQVSREPQQRQLRQIRRTLLETLGANATAEEIRDKFNLSLATAIQRQKLISQSDEAFEARLREAHLLPSKPFTKPGFWRSLTWGHPAQPVVKVSWYEARAYCLWLNDVLGSGYYRLPSEAEWEAAGRGPGRRRYPWGDRFDRLHANTAETRLGVTTPVGVFPSGTTPETGLWDLCGNVWEWTATPWIEGETWTPALVAMDCEQDVPRVVRGGCWRNPRKYLRLAFRERQDPSDRYRALGFRVCRAYPI